MRHRASPRALHLFVLCSLVVATFAPIFTPAAAQAADTPAPSSVTLVGGQQQEVGVEVLGDERAGRRQDVHPHTDVGVVAQPVRRVPVRGALDRDGERLIGVRRAAQRVAAGDRSGTGAR